MTEPPAATVSEPPSEFAANDSSSLAAAEESNELAEDLRGLFPGPPPTESRHSRVALYLVLIVLLGFSAAAAAWHWRDEIFVNRQAGQVTAHPAASTVGTPASAETPHPTTPAAPAAASSPPQKEAAAAEGTPPVEQSSTEPAPADTRATTHQSKARIRQASEVTRTLHPQETEGEKYLYGHGVPVDCDRAQKDLLAATHSRHSSARAEQALGSMYATGHCVIRDLPLAYRWFARAQRQNRRPDPEVANNMKDLWNRMSPEERKLATE